MVFSGGSTVKNPPAKQIWSLGQEDPLEEGMATHSSILVWRIPCTEEPGGLHGVAKSEAQLKLLSTHMRHGNVSGMIGHICM